MSISVIIAELVMLHCTKEKKLYQKMKTDKLDAEGEENAENEEKDEEMTHETNTNIPKFPTMPNLNETIALNSKSLLAAKKQSKSKSNGFIQKI
jgi:hypothetical protein